MNILLSLILLVLLAHLGWDVYKYKQAQPKKVISFIYEQKPIATNANKGIETIFEQMLADAREKGHC